MSAIINNSVIARSINIPRAELNARTVPISCLFCVVYIQVFALHGRFYRTSAQAQFNAYYCSFFIVFVYVFVYLLTGPIVFACSSCSIQVCSKK